MTIDLAFNIILFVFFGYCLIDVSALANLPGSDVMGAALWPQIILVILEICLALNIRNIVKQNRLEPPKEKLDGAAIAGFFKSKLFFGIVTVSIMAILLDIVGFVPATFLFLVAYGVLLGQRNPKVAVIASLVATAALFLVFYNGLSIILPRGTGVFRSFALFLESI